MLVKLNFKEFYEHSLFWHILFLNKSSPLEYMSYNFNIIHFIGTIV